MRYLVTGNAGFIGFHVVKRLLSRGDEVVAVDVVNDYYDPLLKEKRLEILASQASDDRYVFHRFNLADRAALSAHLDNENFDRVIHLAAQAGVRYSLENPHAYVDSNIVAFTNILEFCRHKRVAHLTYASTSSVYGANTAMPFRESQDASHPLQFYAATKRANELMAHSYSHLFRLPTTGLRFFTVYGPWGRPDMAPYLFTKNILEGKPIDLFNGGNHTRDFTYIDDIVDGILLASDDIAAPDPEWDSNHPDPSTSNAPYRILNIGNNEPVRLSEYVAEIEKCLGIPAQKHFLPLQPGDVSATFADVSRLMAAVNYKPSTPIAVGVAEFVAWYRSYHGI